MAFASHTSTSQLMAADSTRMSAKNQLALNLNALGKAEARKIMSLEHKALGYRPPPGSLASEAQAAVSRGAVPKVTEVDTGRLREAALTDAARIEEERGKAEPSKHSSGIDLENIGLADARKLMSEEHKALGYRPPPGSLAADAQAAAAKRPHMREGTLDPRVLTLAALKDAARIASERGASGATRRGGSPPTSGGVSIGTNRA